MAVSTNVVTLDDAGRNQVSVSGVSSLASSQVSGRPKPTWKKLMGKDCREWKLTTVDPQERSTWRPGVRSAMRAASQLPGRGPTDVDDVPAPAC